MPRSAVSPTQPMLPLWDAPETRFDHRSRIVAQSSDRVAWVRARSRGVTATDAAGRPCVEVKTTRDLEEALGMPGGNIFHGPLSWPWAEPDAPLASPAERWGVATAHARVLLCGSGAVRGGAVSGVGGHNAAMAVLEGELP